MPPADDPRGTELHADLRSSAVRSTGRDVLHPARDRRGTVTLAGAAPINESDWDDGLPLRAEGYDAYGGLYQGDLNLQIYWDDNADKLQRFVQTLSSGRLHLHVFQPPVGHGDARPGALSR